MLIVGCYTDNFLTYQLFNKLRSGYLLAITMAQFTMVTITPCLDIVVCKTLHNVSFGRS